MTIYFYDGYVMTCEEIEIGMNGTLIIDGYRVVNSYEVLRIVAG